MNKMQRASWKTFVATYATSSSTHPHIRLFMRILLIPLYPFTGETEETFASWDLEFLSRSESESIIN